MDLKVLHRRRVGDSARRTRIRTVGASRLPRWPPYNAREPGDLRDVSQGRKGVQHDTNEGQEQSVAYSNPRGPRRTVRIRAHPSDLSCGMPLVGTATSHPRAALASDRSTSHESIGCF
jgi:hypothetical protein